MLRCFFLAVADDNRVRGFIEITLILHRPLLIFVLGFGINQRQTVADRNIIFSLHARYQCRVAGCPRGCRANVPADTEFDILRMNHPRCHINPDRDIRRFRTGNIIPDQNRIGTFRVQLAAERNAFRLGHDTLKTDRYPVSSTLYCRIRTDGKRLLGPQLYAVILMIRTITLHVAFHVEVMRTAGR